MNKKIIIPIIFLLLCLSLASAYSWNQWLPSPSTGNLSEVLSFDNGRALAITNNAANCYKFVGDEWMETYCPDDTINLSSYVYTARMQRINDEAIMLFYDAVNDVTKLIVYDSSSDSYSTAFTLSINVSVTAGFNPLICAELSGYCYVSTTNLSVYKVYPNSPSYITNISVGWQLLESNFMLMARYGQVFEWNNFSWIDRGTNYANQHLYVSSSERYLAENNVMNNKFFKFNYTVGNFNLGINYSYGTTKLTPFIIDNELFGSTANYLFSINTLDNITTLEDTATGIINSLSYNDVSGYGWAVGVGGILYYLLGESNTGFTLSRGISSGVYNGVANFWAVPTTDNSPVTINVEIFNRQDVYSVYSWDWLGVINSQNVSNEISGALWSNFEAGKTYNVIYTLTDHANNVLTFNDSWTVTAQSQGGFNITDLTASFNHACIGQTILFNINANNSEDNPLTYDYSCDGSKYPLTNYFRFNEFPCAYNTVGNRTVYGYAWDDYSYDNPQSSSIVINISSCAANYTILGKVYDYDTGLPVSGANVTLDDAQTALSDINGNVAFFVLEDRLYAVTITKPDYYSKSVYGSVDSVNGWIITRIGGSEGGVRTSLIVNTVAENGSAVSGSLVSVLEPISGESKFGITDALGVYVFVDMMIGDRILVSASNENKHYEATGEYISLSYGETKEITLTMSNTRRMGVYTGNDRYCKDAIDGVLLCGNLSVTTVGNDCSTDADCISGSCGYSGECDRFNWTICDNHQIERGSYCFLRSVAEGWLSDFTHAIFAFFTFVLVILGIIGLFILLNKKNN